MMDKYNDIPAWFYLNNPNIRTISVGFPDRANRKIFLENLYGSLSKFNSLSKDENPFGKQFVAETKEMQLQEIKQILKLADKLNIDSSEISTAFRLYKYGVADKPWTTLPDNIIADAKKVLNERVNYIQSFFDNHENKELILLTVCSEKHYQK